MAISTITSNSIADGAVTSSDLASGAVEQAMTTQIGGRRNLIINGAMQVAQRGTSSSGGGYNTVDRFSLTKNNLDEMGTTTTQSSDAPDGFSNTLKLVASPAETAIAVNERVFFTQQIEAQNLQHLKFGTSSAESITLSFWVKSDVTGNYAVSLYLLDDARVIGSTYTINSADTWEYKTLTFVGDTTGVIDNDNGGGLQISWYLMAGSDYTSTDNTSWGAEASGKFAYGHTASFGTTDNDNWQITGVQLEVGTVATPFEHRSYGEELALCQRYYQEIQGPGGTRIALGFVFSSTQVRCIHDLRVTMRTAPSIKYASASGFTLEFAGGHRPSVSNVTFDIPSPDTAAINVTSSHSRSDNNCCQLYTAATSDFMGFDAEL